MPLEHLVVLAAGRGTRMDPLTRTRPKVLLPVAGRPLVEHILRAAREAGFRRATLIVHHDEEQVRATFGDGQLLGMTMDYLRQEEPRGTGHAVAALAGRLDGDAVLVSGDAYVDADDLRRLRDTEGIAVGGRRVDDVRIYGALTVENGRVHSVREKPPEARPGVANAGCYRITPELVARCTRLAPSARGELELTDALSSLAAEGEVGFVEVPSWREAGRPWDLLEMQRHLMEAMETRIDGDVAASVDMEGPVVVEEGARVLSGTRIEGPAWIGRDSQVGPGAYLRASTSLGADSVVGASVEVKNSIIGDASHVPHLSYVGDSVIGSGCNLGAGTQVANLKLTDRNVRVHWHGGDWVDTGRRKLGVIMGDDVKTGVNCSINPGTVLCPGLRVPAARLLAGWIEP